MNGTILLYSKYSAQCKRLIDKVSSCGIDLARLLNLQTVCIDNEQIRKQILSDKKLNITMVPSIIVVYNDGFVETYEGAKAMNWLDDNIARYAPPPPHQPQPPLPPPPQPQPRRKDIPSDKTSIEELDGDNGELEELEELEELREPKEPDEQIAPLPRELDRTSNPPRLPQVRKDSGNYEKDDSMFADPQPSINDRQRVAVKKDTRKTRANNKDDIMALAAKMGTERESLDIKPKGQMLENRPTIKTN